LAGAGPAPIVRLIWGGTEPPPPPPPPPPDEEPPEDVDEEDEDEEPLGAGLLPALHAAVVAEVEVWPDVVPLPVARTAKL
jgi:hypothetical protein